MSREDEEKQRTIRVGEFFFAFLEIVELVHDLFDDAFQFAHLRLDSGERLLVGDSAGRVGEQEKHAKRE